MTPEEIARCQDEIAALRRRIGNPDRNDLERLILLMGWKLRAKKGGHPVYVRPGRRPITLPGHRSDLNRITVMKC